MAWEVAGEDEFVRRMEEMSGQIAKEMDAALFEAASIMRDDAIRRAPVRTGRGKKAIKTGERIKIRAGERFVTIGVHAEDHGEGKHMYYQEYGTSGKRANAEQPFLGPAYETKKDDAQRMVTDAVKRALGLK